jgi:hypothetical protein
VLLALVGLFALFYVTLAIFVLFDEPSIEPISGKIGSYENIAILGASGSAGDGILKAALADPGVQTIHVITRRSTPRIATGVEMGKVEVTRHLDYETYTAVHEQIANVDAVYWAIGTSSLGVDQPSYARIHVDFPTRFVREWLDVSKRDVISFHYLSSSDISGNSLAMWAREKFRAEQELFALAEGTHLKVFAYRPDYIRPTDQEAHIGQKLLYAFFAPVMAAVRAVQIGEAMLEITAREDTRDNGDYFSTRDIRALSNVYRERIALAGEMRRQEDVVD